ncbi:von Willebrand factor type A domain-containing protein [Catellatospora sp. KI3]|uniref:vWA domain-containing protein n=1 Tax=Catellatospora sp. KI3 TaxID=3041620 RepID=UPI002483214A|nr:von Willebrand factor type A domain-containing protein [Catellatospora sp. KI3]MDI1461690.1 von Willebrand factor type A domain-containing protein [Catellatospora sp. KI3]
MKRSSATAILLAVLMAAAGCSTGGEPATSAGRPAPPAQADTGRDRGGAVDPRRDDQSTFALDVDTASYTYAAGRIADGRLPEAGTVRPEEFVNSFDQHYPQPRGDGFAVHVDGARLPESHPESSSLRLLRVGLQTRAEDAERRKDAALTFVVDVSGSMGDPGRLDLVTDALHTLVDQLRPTDAVAIVTFNERARVVRRMTRVAEKEDLHRAIDSLRADGSTNLDAGLATGYETARDGFRPGYSNRVILLSDGLANTGNTDADRMLRKVREEADKEIALLGVGVGSEYGDALMERLADRGDGFVVYVSERRQARDVFVRKLPATLSLRALDAKAQVTFDPKTVESYQLIGYDNRRVADEDFRNDRVDGGEVGPGHSVTALYLVKLAPEASGRVAEVRVRWLDPVSKEASEAYESIEAADLGGAFDRADPRLRVTYAAAFFAVALRGDAGGRPTVSDLARIADAAAAELDERAADELADLIREADPLLGRR